MATLKGSFDGDIWFVTRSTAPKTEEIRDNQHVNVAFSDEDGERFASISGLASLVRDPAKVQELWSGRLKTWFPAGKKDPDLALIRVRIDRAEVWDARKADMVHLEGLGALFAAKNARKQKRASRAEDRPAGGNVPPGGNVGAGA